MSATIRAAVEGLVAHFQGHPEDGHSEDKPAVARLESGLKVRAAGPNGFELVSDMSPAVGGGGTAGNPGWYLRAALANCDASIVAIRVTFRLEGPGLTEARRRELLEWVERHSPVGDAVKRAIPMKLELAE